MAKNHTKPARNAIAEAVGNVDWNEQAAKIEAAAKDKAGSRGDALARVGRFVVQDTPAAAVLREACGDAGAQRIIECSRNVLAKLPKLADKIAAGTEWCTADECLPANRRSADASVAVALLALGAGNDRQKAVVAHAMDRYPGGANAQMPAALDALAVFGIVKRADSSTARNAGYVLVDEARAAKLMPRA